MNRRILKRRSLQTLATFLRPTGVTNGPVRTSRERCDKSVDGWLLFDVDGRPPNACRRVGFTLVELLVVIAVIGILLGLLLPAVQAAREASRRNSCANNLKQIGLALQNYAGQKRTFPPGANLFNTQDEAGISWRVLILPFMEESPLYDQIKPLPNGGATDWGPQGVIVEAYFCPSMPRPPQDPDLFKQSNYSGVSGPGRNNKRIPLEQGLCGDISTDGMFFPRSKTTFAKITDGTSHTLAVGERTYLFRDWMEGAKWYGSPSKRLCTAAASNVRYPINSSVEQLGYYVADPDAPAGASFKLVLNDLFFGSRHPGGAQFCLADASVHMITETIDFTLFEDLSTIAGNEVSQPLP